ncbi:alkaline phosphatase family protein, partial [Escherichia coli]|uniref:alkaline phosphatase family protein n=1 Tax=Escherichia coli TaxID=562 RepID=UPI00265BE938
MAQQPERPKLVVGLMVDQMRWDYLYRFADRYGNDGFKRLLKEGFSCENTLINYIPTYTAIGHSSVYTGSVPSIHGIAGNDWIEELTGKNMYCTQDDNVIG